MTVSVENETYPIRKEPTVTPSFITTLNEDGENDVYDECDHSALRSEQESRFEKSKLLRSPSINSAALREHNNTCNNNTNNSEKLHSSEDLLVIPSTHGIPHIFENSSLTRQKTVILPSMKSNLEKIRFPSVDRIVSTIHDRIIIFSLREKARHNFRELRHNFIINDPMGVGNIRRNSPTYELSKYLAMVLNPLKSHSKSRLTNSYELKYRLDNLKLDNVEKMVSFDIVSLYTLSNETWNQPSLRKTNTLKYKYKSFEEVSQQCFSKRNSSESNSHHELID
ncbi:unnamed protein product [Trichobilharzia regenti]|nr:unnamed protein product [Trichobilharzia regenti]